MADAATTRSRTPRTPRATCRGTEWTHPYTREQAAFPAPWLREHKFWPPSAASTTPTATATSICTCPPMESYSLAG